MYLCVVHVRGFFYENCLSRVRNKSMDCYCYPMNGNKERHHFNRMTLLKFMNYDDGYLHCNLSGEIYMLYQLLSFFICRQQSFDFKSSILKILKETYKWLCKTTYSEQIIIVQNVLHTYQDAQVTVVNGESASILRIIANYRSRYQLGYLQMHQGNTLINHPNDLHRSIVVLVLHEFEKNNRKKIIVKNTYFLVVQ